MIQGIITPLYTHNYLGNKNENQSDSHKTKTPKFSLYSVSRQWERIRILTKIELTDQSVARFIIVSTRLTLRCRLQIVQEKDEDLSPALKRREKKSTQKLESISDVSAGKILQV